MPSSTCTPRWGQVDSTDCLQLAAVFPALQEHFTAFLPGAVTHRALQQQHRLLLDLMLSPPLCMQEQQERKKAKKKERRKKQKKTSAEEADGSPADASEVEVEPEGEAVASPARCSPAPPVVEHSAVAVAAESPQDKHSSAGAAPSGLQPPAESGAAGAGGGTKQRGRKAKAAREAKVSSCIQASHLACFHMPVSTEPQGCRGAA